MVQKVCRREGIALADLCVASRVRKLTAKPQQHHHYSVFDPNSAEEVLLEIDRTSIHHSLHQAPLFVHYQEEDGNHTAYSRGALLLNEHWDLTAAQCVASNHPQAHAVSARMLGQFEEPMQQLLSERVFIHPLWKGTGNTRFDSAFLTMRPTTESRFSRSCRGNKIMIVSSVLRRSLNHSLVPGNRTEVV